ncbi:(2Fe-2S)-binding protein [Paraburkholderia phenazinium]|uniref:Isoquinoline 1-oxidoreductase, alpha subunit n=1 Tax=Paraburkholderia phenazinium TaxID=60549 RepID=A0A1G7RXC6_9BURK|nr:(2Fe-2S)-binding protein [Paraburkholderia phenazinium]SDG15334.1 isoquinoline 1-oxidoreductase, alpha subunit [Paraburkholderia phenazinium]
MLSLNINGRQVLVKSDPATPLLWVLRCELGLTGTKFGCGIGVCGACTVHLDGTAQVSCQTVIADLVSRRITTIEGLEGAEAAALKAAWSTIDVVQCGYCQSAQLMTASALLKQKPKPSDQDINDAMSNVMCRCGTYPRIRAAIHEAARKKPG